ncbi:Peptidyl-prolyl cis-trans isomerase [Macleaya cordata]|uniref:peptidylprolyl isomerase n=1 Tax=Macleaya cordata TaxID=56857 RepID=A0A200PU54_MACCD|nr:Peptidyl-prolyl cis-trans isomerase [Macleaya cordata]
MATFFGSPPSLSHSLNRIHHLSSSSQTPPPPPATPPPPELQSQSSSSLRITSSEQQPPVSVNSQQQKPTKAESTDWIASTLTRRFGLGAGLAWAAFLAVGVISEQIKTRLEVSDQEANTRDLEKEEEVLLPNGIRYYDIRVGGGASPRQGDLVVIDLKGKIEGKSEVFVDTFERDAKPLALVMGSRPYTKGMCEGIEYVLRSMKAGGKRRVIVPPSLGFGEKGAELGSGIQIPPSATLEYIVEVDKVSIAPA